MSDTKSPAELESEARRQTPTSHEPAASPAEIEDQARRSPPADDERPTPP
jgi:hypothetical protein